MAGVCICLKDKPSGFADQLDMGVRHNEDSPWEAWRGWRGAPGVAWWSGWADGARHPGRCADQGQLGPADSALPFSVAGVLSFALCVFSWFGLCRVNMY